MRTLGGLCKAEKDGKWVPRKPFKRYSDLPTPWSVQICCVLTYLIYDNLTLIKGLSCSPASYPLPHGAWGQGGGGRRPEPCHSRTGASTDLMGGSVALWSFRNDCASPSFFCFSLSLLDKRSATLGKRKLPSTPGRQSKAMNHQPQPHSLLRECAPWSLIEEGLCKVTVFPDTTHCGTVVCLSVSAALAFLMGFETVNAWNKNLPSYWHF